MYASCSPYVCLFIFWGLFTYCSVSLEVRPKSFDPALLQMKILKSFSAAKSRCILYLLLSMGPPILEKNIQPLNVFWRGAKRGSPPKTPVFWRGSPPKIKKNLKKKILKNISIFKQKKIQFFFFKTVQIYKHLPTFSVRHFVVL